MRWPIAWLTLTLFVNVASALERYPEWFLFPGRYPDIVIGYSHFGASPQVDAERMYCVYRHCIVDGVLEIYQDGESDRYLRNSDYYYNFSLDSLINIKNRLYPVARFANNVLTEDLVTAFSTDSTVKLPERWIHVDRLRKPRWVERNFLEEHRFYYGVGVYTSQGNENDAWKTAEERAMFAIVTGLAVQFHSLKIYVASSNRKISGLEKVTFIKVKCALRNIRPVERWIDRKNRLFYVLVRVPRNGISSPYLQ